MLVTIQKFIRKLFKNRRFMIYTDGSQKGAWGSWAFVVVQKDKTIHEFSGRKRRASSNEMEFQAALQALRFLPEQAEAEIFTDSRIIVESMTISKIPLAFQVQIKEIQNLSSKRKITWHWVKAHSGVIHNERCDELCIRARNLI